MSAVPIDHDALTGVVVEALERMAFVLADEHLGDDQSEGLAERVEIRLSRQEDGAEGRIRLAANEMFALELGSSLIGDEPDEVDLATIGRPALLELANVIGGEVVRLLGGTDVPFKLGLPAAIDADVEVEGSAKTCLVTDLDGRLDVAVELDGALVPA